VEAEFRRLQLSNLANAVINFCNETLGAKLPPIRSDEKAWNQDFIRYMLDPETVLSRRLGVQYALDSHQQIQLYLLNAVGFYLSNDPQGVSEAGSMATRHMTNRFLYAINVSSDALAWLFRLFCWVVFWPIARLTANSFRQVHRKNRKLVSMHHQ
jgi:hypothetical protein